MTIKYTPERQKNENERYKKQKEYIKEYFIDGYEPDEEQLEEMKEKLMSRGQLPELFWKL